MRKIFYALCVAVLIAVTFVPPTLTASSQKMGDHCSDLHLLTYAQEYNYAVTFLHATHAEAHAYAEPIANLAYANCVKSIQGDH